MEKTNGDTHFRRTDNGTHLFILFVGNYIMALFTTELGAEFLLSVQTDGDHAWSNQWPPEPKRGHTASRPRCWGKLGYGQADESGFETSVNRFLSMPLRARKNLPVWW